MGLWKREDHGPVSRRRSSYMSVRSSRRDSRSLAFRPRTAGWCTQSVNIYRSGSDKNLGVLHHVKQMSSEGK